MNEKCELCNREDILAFHHLIPKCLHSNKWFKKHFSRQEMSKGIYICKHYCHKEIHKLFSEKELGKKYNTLKKLLTNEKVIKYIHFITK